MKMFHKDRKSICCEIISIINQSPDTSVDLRKITNLDECLYELF